MPWKAEMGHGCPMDKPWAVMQADGTRMGCHATEDDAKAQMAALHAKEGQMRVTDQAKEPAWMARLRWRAVVLDDMEVLSRAKGGDGRTVIAYAAVFDRETEIRDLDGHYSERIAPVAFNRTIKREAGRIGVFYNHAKTLYGTPSERWSVPLGVPVEMRADAKGLLTVTRYDETPDAEQILTGIKSGSIRGMSFTGAFLHSDPKGPYYQRADGTLPTVTRTEIALSEYGPTPIPAYDDAAIVGVRSQATTERERIEITTEPQPEPEQDGQEGTPPAQDSTPPAPEGTGPAERTGPAEVTTPAAATSERTSTMNEEVQQTMTAQERVVRQGEIRARMSELANQFNGAEMDEESQSEWDRISDEYNVHERAIAADTLRRQRLAELADDQERNGGGERVSSRTTGYGSGTPAFHRAQRPEDIYDLGELRNRARSLDDLPGLYRENALRALELARFPGVGSFDGFTREDAQRRVQELLDGVDDGDGTLARRILVTGSPTYERAFGKWLARGGFMGLTSEEQRALSMGSATSAQVAVPFTLDPTVILTSDGATNPLRAIARVETITGRAWEGVTSAGITVARAAEAAAASDNAPALAQPTVTPTRVQGFVPFSIESDQDWTQLRSEMTRLLQDAKDMEEATSFVTGNGTAPNPGGIASTLTTASNVNDGYASFEAADIFAVENALPPRFQTRARWLGRKNTYNLVRALDTNGTLYARLTEGRPNELIGYPAHESSAMYLRNTAANRYLILGDFSNFIIVDKAGMDVELIPHLFDVTNNMPTGQRGLYAIWRNNAAILVGNAFRALTYAT